MTTVAPWGIEPSWHSNVSEPYSSWYVTEMHLPGSLPCFRTGTNAHPSRDARIGPNRNPLREGEGGQPRAAQPGGEKWGKAVTERRGQR